MTVVTANYQISLTGLYGSLLTGAGTEIEFVELDGLEDLPDVRNFDRARAFKHGFFLSPDLYGKRVITYTMQITAKTEAAFRAYVDQLAAATSDPQNGIVMVGQLPFHPFGQWQVTGQVRKRSLPVEERFSLLKGTAVIQVECSDARVYSAVLHSATSGVTTSVGGLTLPLTMPLDLGGTGDSGLISVVNAGSFPTPWSA